MKVSGLIKRIVAQTKFGQDGSITTEVQCLMLLNVADSELAKVASLQNLGEVQVEITPAQPRLWKDEDIHGTSHPGMFGSALSPAPSAPPDGVSDDEG